MICITWNASFISGNTDVASWVRRSIVINALLVSISIFTRIAYQLFWRLCLHCCKPIKIPHLIDKPPLVLIFFLLHFSMTLCDHLLKASKYSNLYFKKLLSAPKTFYLFQNFESVHFIYEKHSEVKINKNYKKFSLTKSPAQLKF